MNDSLTTPVQTSPLTRSRDLRARALLTNRLLPGNPQRMAATIVERREALDLLEEMEAFTEGVLHEHRLLSSMVFELASQTTRGANGHSWKKDLEPGVNATKFYQALHKIVRWLSGRSR